MPKSLALGEELSGESGAVRSMNDPHGTGRPIPVEKGVPALMGRLREAQWGLVAVALAVGAGAGLGAIVFRWLIKTFTQIFSGHADYSAAGHAANPHVPWLGPFFVLLVPVVAGLIYGPLVQKFAPEARGHGGPEGMLAGGPGGGGVAPPGGGGGAPASAPAAGAGGAAGPGGRTAPVG